MFDLGHNPLEFTDGDGEVFVRFLDVNQEPLPDEEGWWYLMEYQGGGVWEFDENNWFPVPSQACYWQLDIFGAAAGNPIISISTLYTTWEVDF